MCWVDVVGGEDEIVFCFQCIYGCDDCVLIIGDDVYFFEINVVDCEVFGQIVDIFVFGVV